jgi:hypothetical protein
MEMILINKLHDLGNDEDASSEGVNLQVRSMLSLGMRRSQVGFPANDYHEERPTGIRKESVQGSDRSLIQREVPACKGRGNLSGSGGTPASEIARQWRLPSSGPINSWRCEAVIHGVHY